MINGSKSELKIKNFLIGKIKIKLNFIKEIIISSFIF